jgi:hypothetical protein
MADKTLSILPVDCAHAVDLSSVRVFSNGVVKLGDRSEVCDGCLLVWALSDVLGFIPARENLCPLCTLRALNKVAQDAHAW